MRKIETTRPIALLSLSRSDLQTPSTEGWIGDKVEGYASAIKSLGFDVRLLRNISFGRMLGNVTHPKEPIFLVPGFLVVFLSCTWALLASVAQHGVSVDRAYARIKHAAYKLALKRTNPKIVLGIDLQEELIRAARDLGILTIEVQHGQVLEESYIFNRPDSSMPDYFFAWDSFSSAFFDNSRTKAVVVGHPLEQFLSAQAGLTTLSTRVCVSVQWGTRDSVDPFGAIPKDLDQGIRGLIANGVDFFFRTHPVFDAKPWVRKKFRKWVDLHYGPHDIHSPREHPMASEIEASWANLTSLSSSVFEFSLAGAKVAISNREHFKYCEKWLRAAGVSANSVCYGVNELLRSEQGEALVTNTYLSERLEGNWSTKARLAIQSSLEKAAT